MSQTRIASYRGGYQRTGEYLDVGVPDLHGIAWHFEAADQITSPPIVAEGLVFFGCRDGFFYALDRQTGDPLWRYQMRGWTTIPADVADGVVYFGDDKGVLYALQLQTGRLCWTWDANHLPGEQEMFALWAADVEEKQEAQKEEEDPLGDWSLHKIDSLLVSAGSLYFSCERVILALDLSTRSLKWWQCGLDPEKCGR